MLRLLSIVALILANCAPKENNCLPEGILLNNSKIYKNDQRNPVAIELFNNDWTPIGPVHSMEEWVMQEGIKTARTYALAGKQEIPINTWHTLSGGEISNKYSLSALIKQGSQNEDAFETALNDFMKMCIGGNNGLVYRKK